MAALLTCACGSGDGSGAGKSSRQRPILVAALGDSITAGNPGYDPNPRVRAALRFGHDPRSQYEYWAHRADPRLRFRNCGVFGETTAQIAARLRGCARSADVVIVEGGINDVAESLQAPAALQRLAVSRAGTTLGQIVTQAKGLGLRVALADVLPWNRAYPAAAPQIDRLNRLIGATARVEGVPLLPFNAALADPANPDLMRSRLTADGDHPSIAGYRRLGELVAARLRRSA